MKITLPTTWQQLTQQQLRKALQLYVVYSDVPHWRHHVKVAMFLSLTGATIVRRADEGFLCRFPGQRLPVLLRDGVLPSVLAPLSFLDEPDHISVRLDEASGHKAVDFELRKLPFGQYLVAENLYQAFIANRAPEVLQSLAAVLYPSAVDAHASFAPEETFGVFLWFGAVKNILAEWFPHYFRPAEPSDSPQPITRETLRETTLAQIRLLTGGDVTKQPAVLEHTDTWTALAELDAQALIAEKLKSKPH